MRHAANGRETNEQLERGRPDLVLLDVMLPDESGFEICRRLRRDSAVPVLFLSARDSDADKIRGLGLGGDDYIVKSATPAEVVARVKAVLRRASPPGGSEAALRRARGRPGRARGQLRGAADRADCTRVRAAARPRRASAAGVQPRPAVRARLGLVRRPQRGRGVHRAPAAEDRARAGETALHHHRLGRWVPARSGEQMRRAPVRIRTFLLGTVLVLLLLPTLAGGAGWLIERDHQRASIQQPLNAAVAYLTSRRSELQAPATARGFARLVDRLDLLGQLVIVGPSEKQPAVRQSGPRAGIQAARRCPARQARRPPGRALWAMTAGSYGSERPSRRQRSSPTCTTGRPPAPPRRSSRSSAGSSSSSPSSRSRSGSPAAGWSRRSPG